MAATAPSSLKSLTGVPLSSTSRSTNRYTVEGKLPSTSGLLTQGAPPSITPRPGSGAIATKVSATLSSSLSSSSSSSLSSAPKSSASSRAKELLPSSGSSASSSASGEGASGAASVSGSSALGSSSFTATAAVPRPLRFCLRLSYSWGLSRAFTVRLTVLGLQPNASASAAAVTPALNWLTSSCFWLSLRRAGAIGELSQPSNLSSFTGRIGGPAPLAQLDRAAAF